MTSTTNQKENGEGPQQRASNEANLDTAATTTNDDDAAEDSAQARQERRPPPMDGNADDDRPGGSVGSRGVDGGGVDGGSTTTIKEETILAQSYVPQALRSINEVAASVLLATPPSAISGLVSNVAAIRAAVVPSCGWPEGAPTLNAVRPLRCIEQNDFYDAVLDRMVKLNNCFIGGAAAERVRQLRKNSERNDNFRKRIENASNVREYCEIFEVLLDMERKEEVLMYERYSDYDARVMVHRENASASQDSFCSIKLPGVADAKPPVRPGDVLLLRTQKRIGLRADLALSTLRLGQLKQQMALQRENRMRFGPNYFQTGPLLYRILEVRCVVTNVQRKNGGIVSCTWLEPMISDRVRMLNPYGFNLRLVPSVFNLCYYLTALDWLKRLPEELLAPLLFPTEAPIIPLLHPDQQFSLSQIDEDFEGGGLNVEQSEFIKVVLRRMLHPEFNAIRSPMILTGPAGTGKTRTVLSCVLRIVTLGSGSDGANSGTASAPEFRILVCTPSHTAADVITRRLGQHKSMTRDTLFRLFSPFRAVETVPVSILQYCRQSTKNNGAFCIPHPRELLQFKVIVCTSLDAHLLYEAGITNHQLRFRRRDWQIQLAQQCQGLHVKPIVVGVDDPHFTHLFIDEAAQATEPESLIPLSVVVDPGPGSRKVDIILSGDPRQLSPTVYSRRASALGLGRSWMERLLLKPEIGRGSHMLGPERISMTDFVESAFRENLSTFLTINYRGHPSFLMMPSSLFYFDRLTSFFDEAKTRTWVEVLRYVEARSKPVRISATSNGFKAKCIPRELIQKKQFDWPIHFRGVEGNDTAVRLETGFSSNSWSNEKEAEEGTCFCESNRDPNGLLVKLFCLHCFACFLRNTACLQVVDIVMTLCRQNVSTASIGIMAPFRGQVVLIRKLLRVKQLGGVNVGLVEDYQAVERDVIVLSLTRSSFAFVDSDIKSSLGMFGQPKRSNVALTRAEHLFIVVSMTNRSRFRTGQSSSGEILNLPLFLHTLPIAGRKSIGYDERLYLATVSVVRFPKRATVRRNGRQRNIPYERVAVAPGCSSPRRSAGGRSRRRGGERRRRRHELVRGRREHPRASAPEDLIDAHPADPLRTCVS